MTELEYPKTVYEVSKYVAKVTPRVVYGVITPDEAKAKGASYWGMNPSGTYYQLKPKAFSTNQTIEAVNCFATQKVAEDHITRRLAFKEDAAAKELKKASEALRKWRRKVLQRIIP